MTMIEKCHGAGVFFRVIEENNPRYMQEPIGKLKIYSNEYEEFFTKQEVQNLIYELQDIVNMMEE